MGDNLETILLYITRSSGVSMFNLRTSKVFPTSEPRTLSARIISEEISLGSTI